jgi:hypothetical protein
MWKKILFKILDGEVNLQSPFHPEGVMRSLFVIVNNEDRMGYLWIWCSKTFTGINISRLKIPENVKFYYKEDVSQLDIPEINFVDPSVNGGGL